MKTLVVEKNDLIYNIKRIKEFACKNNEEECKIIGVIKGNGYGLGLTNLANILLSEGITMLAVATYEEAIELRSSGVEADILLLSSTCNEEEVKHLIENKIILTFGSREAVDIANKYSEDNEIRAHIKIDTGFGRYGFMYTDVEEVKQIYLEFPNIKFEGIFSHFAQAYEKKGKYTRLQFERFSNVIHFLEENKIDVGMKHICNSSAFLLYPDMHLDAVRIGSAFLGRVLVKNNLELKRIAKLESEICETKIIPKGYKIGYSCTETVKRDTKIGVIPVGYCDGYTGTGENTAFRFIDRLRLAWGALKNLTRNQRLTVLVEESENNRKVPCKVLGQVGMFHTVIDITDYNIGANATVQMEIKPIFIQKDIKREYRN